MDKLAVGLFFVFSYTIIIISKKRRTLLAFTLGMVLVLLKVSESMRIETVSEFVDFNTIFLLIGMMVIIGVLKSTGFFQYVAVLALKRSRGNVTFLVILFSTIVALFSTILDNVTTMVMFMPIIFLVADTADIDPLPITIFTVFASNVGGCLTLVGDPPNIIIGNASKIPFSTFTFMTFVPLAISFFFLIEIIRRRLRKTVRVSPEKMARLSQMEPVKLITDYRLMIVSLATLGCVVTGFVLHNIVDIEMSLFALLGAAFLLLYTGKSFDEVKGDVEWNSIIFFIGLFALAHSLEATGITDDISDLILRLSRQTFLLPTIILWFSGIIATITGAIPVVTIFIPIVGGLSANYPVSFDLWIALALGANLGGNGTITGHLANVLSFELANKHTGKTYTFMDFMKIGIPVAFVTMIIANIYLILRLWLITGSL